MRPSSNASFDWQVRDVVIQNLSYKTNNIRSVPFTLHLYLTRLENKRYIQNHMILLNPLMTILIKH